MSRRDDVVLRLTAGEAEQVLTLVLWNRAEGGYIGTRKWWVIRSNRIVAKIHAGFGRTPEEHGHE